LVKFLIILLGVGWILGQLIRYFLRSKLAQFAKQVNEAAREQQQAQQRASRPKDAVNVDFIPKEELEKRKKNIEGGEYVDFEEVKE
jgi:Na+-transporting methylmalonyl-CoA/oxaloacetate decarboxylase gamma subunit